MDSVLVSMLPIASNAVDTKNGTPPHDKSRFSRACGGFVGHWAKRLVHLGGRLEGMMGILGLMLEASRLMLACVSQSTNLLGESRGDQFRKSAEDAPPLVPPRGGALRAGPDLCRGG